jgi:hypothetical protein
MSSSHGERSSRSSLMFLVYRRLQLPLRTEGTALLEHDRDALCKLLYRHLDMTTRLFLKVMTT